jgi:signal transduction histidine kinase
VTRHALPSTKRRRIRGAVAVGVAVIAISGLHYLTSRHSFVLHEVFNRRYYVPIVIVAVTAGSRGGLAVSVLSTLLLYLPHVTLQWHAWPIVEAEQYGEMLMFNVLAVVTGVLADRLRAERQRYHDAAAELREADAKVRAGYDERLRVDRLVTIGRIASGIAHEVRSPLGGLLGSLEILGAEFRQGHPKAEFVEVAKREIARLQRVVTDFLEFAQPTPPTVQVADLPMTAEAAARLARPALACRGVSVDVRAIDAAVTANVDAEQVQRALLGIMLADAAALRDGRFVLTIQRHGEMGEITIELEGATSLPAVDEIFEPFPASGRGHGLALATAARLIENQRGAVRAEIVEGRLRYVVDLPMSKPTLGDAVGHLPETASIAQTR